MSQEAVIPPKQFSCPECGLKMFYVMLQPDGSVQAYCTHKNHMTLLVNVPALCEHLLKIAKESLSETTKRDATEHSDIATATDFEPRQY